MRQLRPVGRGASALKYDLLTAMGAYALASEPGEQRRVLRFMTLITARYNWTGNLMAVGQREIARLWACTERTVKRDIAALKARGWIVVRRQGARGRVSEFMIDLDRVLSDTKDVWHSVGPDFVARLGNSEPDIGNVVPLPVGGAAPIPDANDTTEWGVARHALRAQDEAIYAAWIHALARQGRVGDRLVLKAPSRFHANYVQTHLVNKLLTACRSVDSELTAIEIVH